MTAAVTDWFAGLNPIAQAFVERGYRALGEIDGAQNTLERGAAGWYDIGSGTDGQHRRQRRPQDLLSDGSQQE
jgi:hypothetical protein